MKPRIGRKIIKTDQFYTTAEAVNRCLRHIVLDDYDCVIEPCAGSGAFVSAMPHSNIIGLDIDPKANGIIRQDFFAFRVPTKYKRVLVIGNPPFGIHHKLSDAFLCHAFAHPNVQTVAFILPNTYNKHTRQRIIPQDWRIKAIVKLERNSFTYNGKPYHMPCSFFVLDKSKGRDLRFDPARYSEASDFAFGTADDFAFFVLGANPARIILKPTANNRGYFIKPKIDTDTLIQRFKQVDWQGNSCASGGVAWFTKPELVKHYNAAFPLDIKTHLG